MKNIIIQFTGTVLTTQNSIKHLISKMTKFSQNTVSSDNANCSKGVVPITMY